jgi:hypothetical protein
MNNSEEVNITNQDCVYIMLSLLRVSAFLESHHQARKKTHKLIRMVVLQIAEISTLQK